MSAITGIFYRDGRSVSSEQITKMNNRLSHRGPDGSKVWVDGPVAFGHQMLHTTPESLKEELPFEDADSGLVITSDARIDNRDELAPLVGLEDVEDIPDSLFILKSYQKWGEECPEKLLGDFAFAIWDKNNEKLFCARDHMGVKPFYYYLSDKFFFFATEIKALLTIPTVPYETNEQKIAFHLVFITDKESTFYKDIHRLAPAHSLILNNNKHEIKKYWELDPEFQIEMDSDEEYINEFFDIFAEAVKCRLRSAFPLGYDLSGGLDSSSIVCMAKKIQEDNAKPHVNLKTFSFIFKDFPNADERYYIKKVVEKGGITSYLLNANEISPLEQVENILWNIEEPFNYPNVAVMWNLIKKAPENNVRIVLTGEGGDSVISKGQNYFRDLAVTMQWKKLFREIRDTSNNFNKNKYFLNQRYIEKNSRNKSFYNILVKQVFLPLIPDFLRKIVSPLYYKQKHIRMKPDTYFLNKEFIESRGIDKSLEKRRLASKRAKTSREFHHFILNTPYNQEVLELNDRLTAAFSIEKRHPFYDKRLIEFCYAIPTEIKFQFGWDRYILRMAMENILPAEIQWRFSKQDYLPPLQKNLIFFEKKFLEEIIYDDNKKINDYVDLDVLKKIYENYKSQNAKSIDNKSLEDIIDAVDVWLGTILYIWLWKNIEVEIYR